MKIFDKASWQTDHGISKEVVIAHFAFIFKWLDRHKMLSPDGLEILELGIDEDISLHEGLVNKTGLQFLNECYDKLITDTEYDVACEQELIEKLLSGKNETAAKRNKRRRLYSVRKNVVITGRANRFKSRRDYQRNRVCGTYMSKQEEQ